MKRFRICTLVIIAVIAFVAGVAGAAQDVVNLKFATFQPASSNFHQMIVLPWCEKIAKESRGRLICQIYPAMQLGGSPAQLLDQARDGVADIVLTVPTYQPGRFTKSEVFELPFMVKSAERGNSALWDYLQKNALDEYKGTKLLFTHLHDVAQLHFGTKSVKNLAELKGLKIGTPTRLAAKAITELGGVPVQMPTAVVSEAVARNVVAGVIFPWESMTALKMQEITKTHTETSPKQAKLSSSILVLAMNLARYNSLPPELQKIIDNNSGIEASGLVGKVWGSGMAPARKIAQERHNTFNVLSDTEYKQWLKATERVNEVWIKEVNAKGGNGKELLNQARELLLKYKD